MCATTTALNTEWGLTIDCAGKWLKCHYTWCAEIREAHELASSWPRDLYRKMLKIKCRFERNKCCVEIHIFTTFLVAALVTALTGSAPVCSLCLLKDIWDTFSYKRQYSPANASRYTSQGRLSPGRDCVGPPWHRTSRCTISLPLWQRGLNPFQPIYPEESVEGAARLFLFFLFCVFSAQWQ